MSLNKQAFLEGEADNWFKRNIQALICHDEDRVVASLSEWLQDFKTDITTIAEIGCGAGNRLSNLAHSLNAKGIGIEPSEEAVKFGQLNYENVKVLQGVSDALPIEDNSCDFVHLGFFLYLVDRQDYLKTISEVDRVLSPGSFLSILDFDPGLNYSKKYHHLNGVKSFKCDNAQPFLASGLYYLVNKYSFSHQGQNFNIDQDERVSLTLLYKEKDSFPLVD
ncbi:class I SAM-dependent methyltransferase [Pseudovibrio sp. JE062]|uniref:class I SAM-dependent methyltransferase n=1 Tax=Pseudovibrio sp. JE062 TaxID=439495 RepID=UPI000186F659|nr:class I SAM-dependent methyltransferase [Pseudovibrio sp. JE062]EEA93226.1 Methyltransferase domain family protein [Pseudovibrio sp. JE062]